MHEVKFDDHRVQSELGLKEILITIRTYCKHDYDHLTVSSG